MFFTDPVDSLISLVVGSICFYYLHICGIMNKRIQQLLITFRKVLSQNRAGKLSHVSTQGKEDSLSKAIRTEKDGKIFMAELKNAKHRAR
ncbi:hypothetical protein OC25_03925 [Pedobacter kyungheensis]|uniref:Uncharacterized protein n=1 Tax=Pedobacter kyungheensis TaxID=1069985 RepID=A0A0C1G7Y4_9SPHI|nr:hypothetical protein [Pedobacter kyungheensis]KIA96234.1 hypothetical protein OC25_03925 [Pedobacter kyungheensis]